MYCRSLSGFDDEIAVQAGPARQTSEPCDVLAAPTHRVGFQDVPGRQQGRGYCALDALRLAGFTIDTQFFQNVARCQALAVKSQTGGDMDRGQLRWN